jgi:hypothetical protein
MVLQPNSGKCPNCSASVVLRPDENGLVTCEYCDHQYRIAARSPQALGQAGGRAALVVALAGVLIVLGVGLAAFFMVGSGSDGGGPASVPMPANESVKVDVPGLEKLQALAKAASGERHGWDDVGGPPQVARIDGTEHVVGRIRTFGSDELQVSVIRASDLKARFSTPPLGTYGGAYRAIHHQVAGKNLLVSDGNNALRVYSLSSGKELKKHPLTDRVERLCPMPGKDRIWIQVLDKRHAVFNPKTLAIEEAGSAKSPCPRPRSFAERQAFRRGVKKSDAPRVDGFAPKRVFSDGKHGVVFGAKKPGTPVPIAVGFDPKSKAVSWNKSILQVNPSSFRTSFYNWQGGLAGGRFITFYGVGSDDEWRAVGFDALSGDLLWERKLKPIFAVDKVDDIVVTEGFVYLVRTSSLDVLDAKTGKEIGTVGDETYD